MTGQTIAHYQILEPLGEGGMGVVYRALDTHLDRPVAIKVLRTGRLADAGRRKRFVQEAKAASALNHPNIITIHDIDTAGGVGFIAMEYVHGKTLGQLIGRKGLGLNETLKYAVQVADALAAAHAAGIVHRDIKPANIMVTDSGRVKIVDFGLAKLTESAESGELNATLTLKPDSAPQTEEAAIVGTVAYMSPEQAEGKRVDARSDIFSFGAVLYEMVTGQRAFPGGSKLSTLSAVLRDEPKPISETSPGLPRELEKIIARCLRKDPDRRFHSMADLKLELLELKEESESGALEQPGAPGARRVSRWWIGGAAALVLFIAALVWRFASTGGEQPGPPLAVVPLTGNLGAETQPSFSPDGNQVAFAWNGPARDNFDIYVKLIGAGPSLRLTTNPARDCCLAWSPNGRYIAFVRAFQDRAEILSIPALGGSERKLGTAIGFFRSKIAWSPDGRFLALPDKTSREEPWGLFLLSVETGEKRRLTAPPKEAPWGDLAPAFSPDGSMLAFARDNLGGTMDLCLLPLNQDGSPAGDPRPLLAGAGLLWGGLDWTPDGQHLIFSADRTGTRRLWTIPASGGAPQPLAVGTQNAENPAISRSGHRLAFTQVVQDADIWRIPMGQAASSGGAAVRFIASTRNDMSPQYSPDGRRIAFESERTGYQEIWVCDADGSNAVQVTSFAGPAVGSPRWSPNGQFLVLDSTRGGRSHLYAVDAGGGGPRQLTNDKFNDVRPSWSPDGHWIYFGSDRGGSWQVWRLPVNGHRAAGAAAQLTKHGGREAFASPDGKFVYYSKLNLPGIWRVPPGGGEETRVLERGAQGHWTVAKRGLYLLDLTAKPHPAIQLFDFAAHRTAQIPGLPAGETLLTSLGNNLAVSPDERSILFVKLNQPGSEIMLVENFR